MLKKIILCFLILFSINSFAQFGGLLDKIQSELTKNQSTAPAPAPAPAPASTSQLKVGTYRSDFGEIDVKKVDLTSLTFDLNVTIGTNIGQASGTANNKNGKYIYENKSQDCKLTFENNKDTFNVSQDGDCQFGMGVNAEGMYKFSIASKSNDKEVSGATPIISFLKTKDDAGAGCTYWLKSDKSKSPKIVASDLSGQLKFNINGVDSQPKPYKNDPMKGLWQAKVGTYDLILVQRAVVKKGVESISHNYDLNIIKDSKVINKIVLIGMCGS